MPIDDHPRRRFDSAADFRAWLAEHADDAPGIRLELAKKGAPVTTVTYAEALDAALEQGWIDGRRRSIDAHFFEQHFTPRATRSPWSQRNVEIVERKIAAGEMQPRGLAEVERARADGRWERAYAGSRTAEPPPDFLAALAENPAAQSRYAALSAQDRFVIYFRLHALTTPEARARKIAGFIDLLNRGEPIP